MKKLLSSICASILAASFAVSSAAPLAAAPLVIPKGENVSSDVQYVRDGWRRQGGGHWRGGGRRGDWNRGWAGGGGPWGGRDMPYYNRGGVRGPYYGGRGAYYGGGRNLGYYNGYRGYRYYRPGYRYYNDFWFPAAAFLAGALITGAIVNQGPRVGYGGGSAHQQWCYNRYRSYRAWDNTFQPYNGPRRLCYSPYN